MTKQSRQGQVELRDEQVLTAHLEGCTFTEQLVNAYSQRDGGEFVRGCKLERTNHRGALMLYDIVGQVFLTAPLVIPTQAHRYDERRGKHQLPHACL